MRLSEIFRLVFINLKQNKFKVFLTSLGIVVGAATIVMVIAIGEGGKRDIAAQFKNLNAGTITVTSSSNTGFGGMMLTPPSGGGMPTTRGGTAGGTNRSGNRGMTMPTVQSQTLTEEGLADILFFVPDIITGSISASTDTQVLGGSLEEAEEYTVVGTEQSYAQISNLNLLFGDFLTEEDQANTNRCVVLGYTIAVNMFDNLMDAYDSKVEIDGRTYTVNGVLQEMGTMVSGINPDSSIFMPYTTAAKYLFDRNVAPQYSILVSDVDQVATVMENIELVLKQANPDASYAVKDAGTTMEAAMQSANTLSILLLAVAVIVFIVGGIGIMNVLFVSIKERTREIGILKAIGTKKSNILLLFMTEANMISVLGGIFGVLLSLGIAPFMVYLNISAVVTLPAILLALIFAVITGTLFGFYPAWKASALVPIEALNND